MSDRKYDVIVIGGSYAGLSAAMSLGRLRRKVLVIDCGLPCNRQTPHAHNFITQDGQTPAAIAAKAREQVSVYDTVMLLNGLAVGASKDQHGFSISTGEGQSFEGKKLVIATGIKDIMPDVKGFSECWGISVVHCPYCHGHELREKKTAIMANGEKAFHLASLVSNLTGDITVLTSETADFQAEQMERLGRRKIRIVEARVKEIVHRGGYVESIVFEDNSSMAFDAVYAAVPFVQHSDIPVALGCELTENGHIKVDGAGKTTVDGVFACGDNSSMMRSVSSAVFTGSMAGAMINRELTEEEF